MPRLSPSGLCQLPRSFLSPTSLATKSSPLFSPARKATNYAGGRPKEEHVVNRTDANDIQAEASQQGMRSKQEGKEDSMAISQKSEGHGEQAKKDYPEAPEPVIGMNDERAQVRP